MFALQSFYQVTTEFLQSKYKVNTKLYFLQLPNSSIKITNNDKPGAIKVFTG